MVNFFREIAEAVTESSMSGVSDFVICSIGIVLILLAIVSIISLIVQGYLLISYLKYNKKKNSIGMTGQDIARKILDENGCENIKVKCTGSILWGNSYSHYFKKVRLRRLTWKKDSVTSLAMASQKSCLAILDKEGDPDMKTRVKLTPLVYVGPIMCLPLIILGIILDIIIFNAETLTFTMIFTAFGFLLYVVSFVMAIMVIKTEKKAQQRAYELLKSKSMATDEELDMLKELFRLYNIEYINDMIIALLELIYRILQIVAEIQKSNNN